METTRRSAPDVSPVTVWLKLTDGNHRRRIFGAKEKTTFTWSNNDVRRLVCNTRAHSVTDASLACAGQCAWIAAGAESDQEGLGFVERRSRESKPGTQLAGLEQIGKHLWSLIIVRGTPCAQSTAIVRVILGVISSEISRSFRARPRPGLLAALDRSISECRGRR